MENEFLNRSFFFRQLNIYFTSFLISRGEAAKLAHLIESASLKRKYMTKNDEKTFI